MNELISVIIPTYNRANIIGNTLKTVLTQTYQNIEIIVVDGGDDNTLQIIQQLDDSRIRYVNRPCKVSEARNIGIIAAKGDYIAFLDSDDIWPANKLTDQYNLIIQQPDNVAGAYCYTNFQGLIKPEENHKQNIATHYLDNITPFIIGTSTVLLKKSVVNEIGYFEEELSFAEDILYWLRILEKYEMVLCESATVVMTHQEDSLSTNQDYSEQVKHAKRMVNRYGGYYRFHPVSHARYLEYIALREIRTGGSWNLFYQCFQIDKNPRYLLSMLLAFIHPQLYIFTSDTIQKRRKIP